MNILNLPDTQVLLLDLGKVLINIHEEEDWWNNYFLPNFDYEAIMELEDQDFFNLYDYGEVSSNFFIDALRSVSIKRLSKEKIIKIWNSKIQDMPKERVELLKELKQKHSIFLLSNTNEIHIDYIDKYVLDTFGFPVFKEYFDACIYSHQICMKKPHRKIFELSHKVIGEEIPKKNILFFDDMQIHVNAAKKYGFQAFLVENNIMDYVK